jgi:hypothetical protein
MSRAIAILALTTGVGEEKPGEVLTAALDSLRAELEVFLSHFRANNSDLRGETALYALGGRIEALEKFAEQSFVITWREGEAANA